MSAEPVLDIRGVTKSFGCNEVLRGIDLKSTSTRRSR